VLDTLWKNLFQQHPPPSPRERSHTGSITTCTGQQFTRSPSLPDYTVNREYRLGPLETSSAMATGSHGVDFQNSFRKQFPQGTTPPRLPLWPTPEWLFLLPPTQDRLTLWCREYVTDNPRKGHRRFRRFRRCTRVFLQGSDPFLLAVRES
jgi:hypothetical protein